MRNNPGASTWHCGQQHMNVVKMMKYFWVDHITQQPKLEQSI